MNLAINLGCYKNYSLTSKRLGGGSHRKSIPLLIFEFFSPNYSHPPVGLRSNDRSRMFRGFHVSVTSDDAKCTPGKLKAYHKGVKEVKHCNVLVNSKEEPTVKVPITWKAPPCGCVTFR